MCKNVIQSQCPVIYSRNLSKEVITLDGQDSVLKPKEGWMLNIDTGFYELWKDGKIVRFVEVDYFDDDGNTR